MQEFDLIPGDKVYLFTDGYQDQFGGQYGKKFMKRRFRELLLSFGNMGMSDQKELLWKAHQDWKGDYYQVDDILVIGLKI